MDLPAPIIGQYIRRGAILHSTIFDYIGHGKFFVVIGVADNKVAGYFFINSNINKALENKPEQYAMQYPIRRSDYGFLQHDSFICATDIKEIPFESLVDSIKGGGTRIVDSLKTGYLDELLEAARASKLFSPKDKEKYLYREL